MNEIFFQLPATHKPPPLPPLRESSLERLKGSAISITGARILPSCRISGRPNKCDLEFAFAGHGLLGVVGKKKKIGKEVERGILLATG